MTPVKPWTIILVIPKWRYIVKRYFDDSASSAIGAFLPTFLMVRFAPLFCAILINVLCFMALQTFVESVVSEAVSNTNKQSQLNWTSCYNERSILVFKPEVITLKKNTKYRRRSQSPLLCRVACFQLLSFLCFYGTHRYGWYWYVFCKERACHLFLPFQKPIK